MIEMKAATDEKLPMSEGKKIWANFRKYAHYDELRELYKKTLPEISKFEQRLQDNNDFNERIVAMIQRLDTIICDKSDRQVIKEFREFVEKSYITRDENKEAKEATEARLSDFALRCDEMEDLVKFQARQLQKEMFSAVRRAFNQHQQKEENQPVSMATVMEQMKGVVAVKADQTAIDQIVSEKANKVDTEMCLRWVDLLHKMVNKVVLLLTTKLKVDIDLVKETANSQQNTKVQLLQQGLIISKWIESFDSQNVNDFYFQTEKEKQPQKIQEVQLQFKRAIDEIERTELSPNLV